MAGINYPCVLLINDIHVSKDHIAEFELNWNEALSVCERMNIKQMAIGGDLFMSRSSQTLEVLLAVHDAFIEAERKGIKIFMVNGNHDKVSPEAIRGYCHVFDRHKNVSVGDEHITIADDGNWSFALHLFAYFPENGSFTQRLERSKPLLAEGKGRKNYLYLHEGINGGLAHSSDNELPVHIFADFDRVFAGHYHNRNTIAGTNIEYTGSSRQHNFGEDEDKGYTVLYSDGSYEFIKNQANKRYRVIEVPAGKVNIHLLYLLEELREDGRYRIKVKVTAKDSGVNIDKEKLLKAGASKVEVITEDAGIINHTPSGLLEKYDGRRIKENYRDFCREKKIDDVCRGLSYLSKIDFICGN